MRKAKKERATRRTGTRISVKHQVSIPVRELRASGLRVGERLTARTEGPGRVVLERVEDVIERYAGALTGVYEPDESNRLSNSWD